MNKLSQFAKSQQGKDLLDKAKTIANDPKTREKIDDARDKFSGHVETAKQKMAEKKKDGGPAGTPAYGEEGAPGASPKYGEQTPADPAPETAGSTPPASAHEEPVDKPDPTYGEEEGDKPLYGEDGPKAA
jgi:hypothetical protein